MLNATEVPNVTVCLDMPWDEVYNPNRNPQYISKNNYTWKNSKINFDNVGSAYLALFQVVRAPRFSSLAQFPCLRGLGEQCCSSVNCKSVIIHKFSTVSLTVF